MSALDGQSGRREAAGELRYLSIRLLGYVAELPSVSLPPRGRVPWSAGNLAELRRLASAANSGEADAALAADALDAIDGAFQRSIADPASGASASDDAARLADYRARRAIAMDRLSRLDQPVERAPVAAERRLSAWERLLAMAARLTGRAP